MQGLIPNGALLLALKLARVINWCPKDNRPSGLYWKNEEALKAVGASRANYFKHRGILFQLGFFTEIGGNLIPQVPELSLLETEQSSLETIKSLVGTRKSPVDNPYSEDTFSEDVLSVTHTKEAVAADATPASSLIEKAREGGIDNAFSYDRKDAGLALNNEDSPPVSSKDSKAGVIGTARDIEASLRVSRVSSGSFDSLNSSCHQPSPISSSTHSASAREGASSESEAEPTDLTAVTKPHQKTFDEIWASLDPETRAKVKRGSEVPQPVYASWEDEMAARMR